MTQIEAREETFIQTGPAKKELGVSAVNGSRLASLDRVGEEAVRRHLEHGLPSDILKVDLELSGCTRPRDLEP